MRYGDGLLDEIRNRTDLVALVGRRVKLVRKGREMWGCCPFHNEKSASFKVSNERRTYKCFGCGKGGDCFRWLVETEGLSFPESVEKLAGEAGVELPKWSPEDEAREQKKKSLYDIVELAAKLHGGQPPKKLSYRGVQPLFEGTEFSVNANEKDGGLELWIANVEGQPTMKGTATWGHVVPRHCERSDVSAVAQRAKAEAIHSSA